MCLSKQKNNSNKKNINNNNKLTHISKSSTPSNKKRRTQQNLNDDYDDYIKPIFKLIFYLLFFYLVFKIINNFFIQDFSIKKIKARNEKAIDRERCMKEYEANKCDKIKIDDGPIINDICDNLRKCISDMGICNIDGIKTYINDLFENKKFFNNIIYIIVFVSCIYIVIKIFFINSWSGGGKIKKIKKKLLLKKIH